MKRKDGERRYCPECGKRNASKRTRCVKCKAPLTKRG